MDEAAGSRCQGTGHSLAKAFDFLERLAAVAVRLGAQAFQSLETDYIFKFRGQNFARSLDGRLFLWEI